MNKNRVFLNRYLLLRPIIAGDLLRAEQNREGSQYGDLIRTYIREGNIVPMEVTIKLLEIAMSAEMQKRTSVHWSDGKGRFLIDGFPRKMDQAAKFDETVWPSPTIGVCFLFMCLQRFAFPPWLSTTQPPKK